MLLKSLLKLLSSIYPSGRKSAEGREAQWKTEPKSLLQWESESSGNLILELKQTNRNNQNLVNSLVKGIVLDSKEEVRAEQG